MDGTGAHEIPHLAERILRVDDFCVRETIFFKGIVSGILTMHAPVDGFIPHEYWGSITRLGVQS